MSGYSLDNHIRVHDYAGEVFIEVAPDPDGIGMVCIRTFTDKKSAEFYGSFDLQIDANMAALLSSALIQQAGIIKMGGYSVDHFQMIQHLRVYDDSNGAFIEIRPHPDDENIVWFNTIGDKTSKEWYGEIDFTMMVEQAEMLGRAIRIQAQKILRKDEKKVDIPPMSE